MKSTATKETANTPGATSMDEILLQILAKSSSADLVLIVIVAAIVWLVATKQKIARGTVELAVKLLTMICGGTLVVRLAVAAMQTFG